VAVPPKCRAGRVFEARGQRRAGPRWPGLFRDTSPVLVWREGVEATAEECASVSFFSTNRGNSHSLFDWADAAIYVFVVSGSADARGAGTERTFRGGLSPSFASSSSTPAKPSRGGDAKPWAPRGSPGHRRDEGLLHHVRNAAPSAALPFRRVNELPIVPTEVKKRSAGHGRRQERSVTSKNS